MMSYARIPHDCRNGIYIREQREGNNPLSMINDRSLSEADKVRVNIQMFDNQMRTIF